MMLGLLEAICREIILKCGVLDFLDEEFVQFTDSDDNNYKTKDNEKLNSVARS